MSKSKKRAVERSNAEDSEFCAMADAWCGLTHSEQRILRLLAERWAAGDPRAGLSLLQPRQAGWTMSGRPAPGVRSDVAAVLPFVASSLPVKGGRSGR